MSTSERQVQYEFKVIVRVSEDAWPHEVLDNVRDDLLNANEIHGDRREIVSVEQIRDYA